MRKTRLSYDTELAELLAKRADTGLLRTLSVKSGLIDLCSNDYLGFARERILAGSGSDDALGSTGSRLLSGNSKLAEIVEAKIAQFHNQEAALIFNSGYDANLGVLSAIPKRGDAILYDELSHASIRDGVRLSYAQSYHFKHNDLSDLKRKLAPAKGRKFVVVESIYSMDGDSAPLNELAELCESECAALIVDEAHATGVVGKRGEGCVQNLGLESEVFARVHTFGKALGCHGAAVVGSSALRSALINFARSFIYTTALPPHALSVIERAYEECANAVNERAKLASLVAQFQTTAGALSKFILPSNTPIQGILVPGNENCRNLSKTLEGEGFDIRPILSPTVPEGSERLRLCLHAFNTESEISRCLNIISERLL